MGYSSAVIIRALALTMLGALGTVLGGLIITLGPSGPPSFRHLGLIQGLAAGLMISISMLDLMPSAMRTLSFPVANLCFFAGVAFFAGIVTFIPDPSPTGLIGAGSNKDGHGLKSTRRNNSSSGLLEAGVASQTKAHRRQQVLSSGLITALGIALHNFPEGITVFLASLKGGGLGLSLAVAIALHNIPEGIAVAMPIYFATRSRWEALKLTIISGLAEPAAVVIVGLLFPTNLSVHTVESMLAAVAGIMVFLSVHELIPLAIEHSGRRDATSVVFLGMAFMSLSLYWLEALGAE